jgi:hypothetical protein
MHSALQVQIVIQKYLSKYSKNYYSFLIVEHHATVGPAKQFILIKNGGNNWYSKIVNPNTNLCQVNPQNVMMFCIICGRCNPSSF